MGSWVVAGAAPRVASMGGQEWMEKMECSEMGQGGMRLNDGCCAEHAVEILLRQRKVVNGGEWATGKGVSW